MKKILFLLALSFTQVSFAQSLEPTTVNKYQKFNEPLFVVNGLKTNQSSSSLPANNIKSITVIKGEKAVNLYGEKAKNGVLEISLKPNANLLNLQSFYTEYKISKIDQLLPIVLNKHFVDEKEYLLLDKSAVLSVKILDDQPFVEPVLLPKGKAIYIEAMETK